MLEEKIMERLDRTTRGRPEMIERGVGTIPEGIARGFLLGMARVGGRKDDVTRIVGTRGTLAVRPPDLNHLRADGILLFPPLRTNNLSRLYLHLRLLPFLQV